MLISWLIYIAATIYCILTNEVFCNNIIGYFKNSLLKMTNFAEAYSISIKTGQYKPTANTSIGIFMY